MSAKVAQIEFPHSSLPFDLLITCLGSKALYNVIPPSSRWTQQMRQHMEAYGAPPPRALRVQHRRSLQSRLGLTFPISRSIYYRVFSRLYHSYSIMCLSYRAIASRVRRLMKSHWKDPISYRASIFMTSVLEARALPILLLCPSYTLYLYLNVIV